MIIFSVYGVRGREQPLVPLSHLTNIYTRITMQEYMSVCVSLCWWQWNELKRANKQASNRETKKKKIRMNEMEDDI